MELRQLRYFVAVAEERHFRRAAARLHVAQPAISEQVRKLEAELGTALLVRSPRSVELTEAGAVLLRDAKRLLRSLEQATVAVERAQEGVRHRVRVGYAPDGVPVAIPRALTTLRERMPGVVVELSCGPMRELLADVRDERLDAAVVALPAPTAGMRVTGIGQERAVAMAPERVVAARAAANLEVLARHRVLLMARAANPAFHDAVTSAFHRAGLVPAAVVGASGTSAEHLLLEVAAGAGIAIVPESVAARMSVPGVAVWPLTDDEVPSCTLVLATRDETPPAALAALLRAVQATARQAAPASLAVVA